MTLPAANKTRQRHQLPGAPFDLDPGLVGYVTEPNCLWAVYRNYTSSGDSSKDGSRSSSKDGANGAAVVLSVADINTQSSTCAAAVLF
jgi:hypothetical protein